MIVTKFICCSCAKRHNNSWGAEKCCPPEIEEVEVCTLCEKEWDEFEEAPKYCECEFEPTEEGQIKLPPQQFLEERGQLNFLKMMERQK